MKDIITFAERAITLLASQFREPIEGGGKTNLQKLVTALTAPCYDINTVELQLYNNRFLATAVGIQLDKLGEILGLPRGLNPITGLIQTDSDYREALYFQVRIDMSTGTPEEVIAALKFLTKATYVQYFEPYPAFYQMFTNGQPSDFSVPPDEIVGAISAMSPAGVQYVPITWYYDAGKIFEFSGDPIVEDFYVNPNPANRRQYNPFHVSTDGLNDLQFQINRGQVADNPDAGCFAESDYDVGDDAGSFAEVLILNGGTPPPL